MKSKYSIVLAGLFVLSLNACSSESKKYEQTQVPEMTTAMPPEIQTSPEPEPEAVKVKKASPKKSDKKKKTKSSDAEVH